MEIHRFPSEICVYTNGGFSIFVVSWSSSIPGKSESAADDLKEATREW